MPSIHGCSPSVFRARMRVLLVEDGRKTRRKLMAGLDDLRRDGLIRIITATTQAQAERRFYSTFVHLVVLDLRLDGRELAGLDVLEGMRQARAWPDVVIYTNAPFGKHGARLLQEVSRESDVSPSVVAVVSKQAELDDVMSLIRRRAAAHSEGRVEFSGIQTAAQMIADRQDRYPELGRAEWLRSSASEIAVEVESVLAEVFGRAPASDTDDATMQRRVHVQELERQGLSSAVLLAATVKVGVAAEDADRSESVCVVKIGPRGDIREEVRRYREFVRYGVELLERVELMEWGERDGLGAIVYSFAGGVYGGELQSLDELLTAGSDARVNDVMASLLEKRAWYNTDAGKESIGLYFKKRMRRQKFGDALKVNFDAWVDLAERLRKAHAQESKEEGSATRVPIVGVKGDPQSAETRISLSTTELVLPSESFFGEDWAHADVPWCLVHGDMHGGNVMVEAGRAGTDESDGASRVCLIDYRSAGPGPRALDAAALEASVRVADAARLRSAFAAAGGASRDASPIESAIARSGAESTYLRSLRSGTARVAEPEVEVDEQGKASIRVDIDRPGLWLAHARSVSHAMGVGKTSGVDYQEYIATCFYYAVKQIGYRRLDSVERARLCAWLSGLYSVLRKLVR